MSTPHRQPAGSPVGGQFAAGSRAESALDLATERPDEADPPLTDHERKDALAALVETALWSSTDLDSGDTLDRRGLTADDLAPETVSALRSDLDSFLDDNDATIARIRRTHPECTPEQVAHDFWLTRNHHGAGFWDRGYGDDGDRLTQAAHAYGSIDLYVGDDGRVHA